MRRASVLSLCLLGILACATAKLQFAVLTPGLLKSGEAGKACLIAQDHTEPIDVDIFVTVGNTNIIVFQGQVQPGENSKCAEFLVPEQAQAAPASFNIKATSGSFNYNNSQTVVVAPAGNNVIITSDKYKYTASETAHFHIMELTNNLRPVETTFPSVHVEDQQGIQLREWQNQSTTQGFLYVPFPIPSDPDFGKHQMVVKTKDGRTFYKAIMVEDYKLPIFSIAVNTPSGVTIKDTKLNYDLNVQYTYKQPVPGKFVCKLCRPISYGDRCDKKSDALCHQVTGELDSQGKYKGSIDLTQFDFNKPGYTKWMKLDVTVTEQGSGAQITETKLISFTSTVGRATFDDKLMSPYFKKNLGYHVAIKVEDGLGQPEVNQPVQFQVNGIAVQTLTSDEDGRAEYELDTSTFETSTIKLQLIYANYPECTNSRWIKPIYYNDYGSINSFFSGSQSFVQLYGPRRDLECGATHNIRAQYVIGKEALEENVKEVKFYYLIMARAKIVHFGEHWIEQLPEARKGEFTINYTALPEHVPTIQVVIMTMVKNELVADTIELSLEKCFKNDVSVSFSAEKGTPGSNVDLQIKATPASVCLGHMYDSSLQLMDQGDALTPEKVLNTIQYAALRGYSYGGYDVTPPQPPCVNTDQTILLDDMYYQPISFGNQPDPGRLLSRIGLMTLTPMPYQQPQLCNQRPYFLPWDGKIYRPMSYNDFAGSDITPTATAPGDASARIRPETHIFYPLFTDASGLATHSIKVPGTITKWKFEAICLSNDTGIGMSKDPANFTSYQKRSTDDKK